MEYWDIYDVNKQPTGRTMKRNDWNMKPGDYHLTVLGVLQNREGKYLITKRIMTKAWAAGWWEVSGGGVQAGESSIEAVRREVIEEITRMRRTTTLWMCTNSQVTLKKRMSDLRRRRPMVSSWQLWMR